MERYENLFAQLKDRKEGAFVPFVTLGDPSVEQSLKIIDTLIEAGADALELGIPFSDPLADGPTLLGQIERCRHTRRSDHTGSHTAGIRRGRDTVTML